MPDPDKLAALEAAGYTINGACVSCVYAVPRTEGWGWCARLEPVHAKHTDGARVSIRLDGICPSYLMKPLAVSSVARGGLAKFVRPGTRLLPVAPHGKTDPAAIHAPRIP